MVKDAYIMCFILISLPLFAFSVSIILIQDQSVVAFAPSGPTPIPGQSAEPTSPISPQINATVGRNFLNYEDPEHGIAIEYPSDWTFYGNIVEASGVEEIVVFNPPMTEQTNGSSANAYVMVSVNPSAGNVSVLDYLNSTIDFNQMVMSNFSQDVQSNFNLIDTKTPDDGIQLAGMPAYELVFAYTFNGTNYKRMEVGTISQGKAYFVTYDTESVDYDKYLPIALKMVDSFHFRS